jgi:hypothetical protein
VRESTRAILLFVILVGGATVSYLFFFKPFMQEQPKVRDVISANSTWSVAMQQYEMRGLISAETYRISNNNGATTLFYAATNRAGTVTKEFTAPLVGPAGTFLFEELRADGIWELDDKPVRPHPVDEYIIEVDQTLGDEGGNRAFGFSDPQFWAATNGQEYQLKLPPKGPIGDKATTLGTAGKPLKEPRYLKIVTMIRAFGPASVLAAENKIRAALAATAKHPIAPK